MGFRGQDQAFIVRWLDSNRLFEIGHGQVGLPAGEIQLTHEIVRPPSAWHDGCGLLAPR